MASGKFRRRRSRRHVKCTICTKHRFGNSRASGKPKDVVAAKAAARDIKEYAA